MIEKDPIVIVEEDNLHRTMPLNPSFYIKDTGKITSAVFKLNKADKETDNALSVNLERLITNIHKSFNKNTHGVVGLNAKTPMELDCECKHTPIEENYAHSSIYGVSNGIARKLAQSCYIIHLDIEYFT